MGGIKPFCNFCKKEISHQKQYCSILCRNKGIAILRRLGKYPKSVGICKECKKEIIAKSVHFDKPNRQFCSRSCFCTYSNKNRIYTDEQRKAIADRATTHGKSKNPLWKVWGEMIRRCEKTSCGQYKNYGARGISVSKKWHTFEVFEEWALKNGYVKGLTIERNDNNGNYCVENCSWVSMSHQAKNRRKSDEWTFKNK